MATNPQRIANRNSTRGRLPAWAGDALVISAMWVLMALVSWVLAVPATMWIVWFWTLYPVLFFTAAWAASIASIEVSPDRIVVRSHVRSRFKPMEEVLRIDARRMPSRPWRSGLPPPWMLDVWLARGRKWRLAYIEPEAGDRVLRTLYDYRKPIWVLTPT